MSESGSVSEWIEDLRAGDSGAATRLWNRFYANLLRIARRRLHGASRRVADEEDLVATAFESFFQRLQNGQFPDLRGRAELWALLVTITDRKAVNCVRRHMSAKRGGGRVHNESNFGASEEQDREALLARVDGGMPPPDRIVSMSELVERLDDDLRRIVDLKLDGFTNEEIAQRRQPLGGHDRASTAVVARRVDPGVVGMSLLPRDDALALTDRKQIDEICLAFEDEWLAGSPAGGGGVLASGERRQPADVAQGIAVARTGLSSQHSRCAAGRRLPGPFSRLFGQRAGGISGRLARAMCRCGICRGA